MIFDCVFFLHRNVLAAVPSAGRASPPARGSPRVARPGRGPTARPAGAARVGGAGGRSGTRVAGGVPWRGSGWRWRGRSSSRTRRVHSDWETGVLVLLIPCTFHRHANWKRWNLWGKSNFPFLLNGFSLILTWFYHVPVEGLRVYTVC